MNNNELAQGILDVLIGNKYKNKSDDTVLLIIKNHLEDFNSSDEQAQEKIEQLTEANKKIDKERNQLQKRVEELEIEPVPNLIPGSAIAFIPQEKTSDSKILDLMEQLLEMR